MKIRLLLTIFLALVTVTFLSCRHSPDISPPSASTDVAAGLKEMVAGAPALESIPDTLLILVKLPAAGCITLSPSREDALSSIGIGGASPSNEPPCFPYSENGLYWSEKFPLTAGSLLNITVYKDSPLSWFGVDWSALDVRGVLAFTDTDEEGWSFNPKYPDYSIAKVVPTGTRLDIGYLIAESGEYQVVVKNSSQLNAQRLFVAVAARPSPG